MKYVGAWERLPDALQRVMAANGLPDDEAKASICRAITDWAIKTRAKLKSHITRRIRSTEVIEGKYFTKLTEITSVDLDWEESRPIKPWMVEHEISALRGFWDLEWLELSRDDVTNVLCPVGTQPGPEPLSKTSTKSRRRPSFEVAQRAIKTVYPQAVPDQAEEPNSILCRRIAEQLKNDRLPGVSDDTILRAAGRRKDRN